MGLKLRGPVPWAADQCFWPASFSSHCNKTRTQYILRGIYVLFVFFFFKQTEWGNRSGRGQDFPSPKTICPTSGLNQPSYSILKFCSLKKWQLTLPTPPFSHPLVKETEIRKTLYTVEDTEQGKHLKKKQYSWKAWHCMPAWPVSPSVLRGEVLAPFFCLF